MQGRFKRDGGAAGDPESRGGTEHDADPRPQDGATPSPAAAAGRPGAKNTPAGAAGAQKHDRTRQEPVDVQPPATSQSGGKHASRLAMRNWSIRTRLVSLLALPVVAATTLGGLRIQSSLDSVNQLNHMELLTEITGHATKLADALQDERDESAGPIVSGRPHDDLVVSSRHETDQQEAAFKTATAHISTTDPSLLGVRSTVDDISRQLQDLKQIRSDAYSDTQYVSQTINSYNQLIGSLLALSQDMAQATSNADMIRSTRALAAFTSAKEYASIQRAIITAALANPNGPKLSATDRETALNAAAEETSQRRRFAQVYGPGADALLTGLDRGNVVIAEADSYRSQVLKSNDAIGKDPRSWLDWSDEDEAKLQAMYRVQAELLEHMQQQALSLRSAAQQDALFNGALILLVLGISLVGAFVVARGMIRSLRRLQDTAQEVAQRRLPDLVRQLSESDPQDLDTSVAEIGINTRDEIGRVARAFDDVHREAVRLAAEQALLRGNVNAMFTNLSRRSQGLIQRQLSLISELESREADPDQLSNLFKLDHLATRMRRNGENLLVLAGEEPGRRWTRPVPLVDVLRAAASEVEQYERIELTQVPPTEVAGRVVNDLVHLLAELLENATSFSSPQTKVRVTGHALPDGRVLIEIHDTGIGLSPDDLADINERLANPPTVDVAVSRRMGLFVVGRLSLRHGIRIQLRPSDSGGTTALVMLPVELTQGGAKSGPPGQQGKLPSDTPAAVRSQAPAGVQAMAHTAGLRRADQPETEREQLPGPEQRAALPGGPAAGNGPQPPRSPGLPTRQRRDPQQEDADEVPSTSWAQPGGADVPRGHDDVRGAGGTAEFPRPDFHGERQQPGGSDQFFTPSRQPGQPAGRRPAPQGQPEFTGRQEGFPPGAPGGPGVSGQQAPGGQGRRDSTGEFFRPAQGSPQPRVPRSPVGGPAGQVPFGGPAAHQDQGTGEFAAPFHTGSGSDVFGPQGRQAPQAGPARQVPQGEAPRPVPPQSVPPRPVAPQPEAPRPVPRADGPQGPGRAGMPGTGSGSDVFGPRGRGAGAPDGGPQAFAGPQEAPQQGYGAPRQPHPDGFGDTGSHRFPPQDPQGLPGGPGGGRRDLPQAPQQPGRVDNFRHGDGELPVPGEPSALPTAGPQDDERSPIFDSLETDWFRRQAAERGELPGYGRQPGADLPVPGQRAPRPGPGQPVEPMGYGPSNDPLTGGFGEPAGGFGEPHGGFSRQAAHAEQPAAPQAPGLGGPQRMRAAPDEDWGASPNDERWRRAEQVREPAAGGITPSGLPRRVPQANLVAGAAQQTQHTGPQVSRAPDDVRGRLTNLRRGIQQGRSAGAGRPGGPPSGEHLGGTPHQQER